MFTVAGIAGTDPHEIGGAYRHTFKNQSIGGGVFTNILLDEVEEVCFVALCVFYLYHSLVEH